MNLYPKIPTSARTHLDPNGLQKILLTQSSSTNYLQQLPQMKRYLILSSFFLTIALNSCQNPGKKAIEIVDHFYNEVYANGADNYGGSLKKSREVLDYSGVSTAMEKLIRNNFLGIPEKGTYRLTTEQKSDNNVIVTSIGKAPGLFGIVVETRNQFSVTKISGQWKIDDSFGLIGLFLNFSIEDTQWNTYWDIKKSKILKEVMDSLKLEIVKAGSKNYYGDAMEGNLRIVNSSSYDLKDLEILIEHFDRNGKSVNTDDKFVFDIIRSKGYREFDWYTSDCENCYSQKFQIKFVRETIK